MHFMTCDYHACCLCQGTLALQAMTLEDTNWYMLQFADSYRINGMLYLHNNHYVAVYVWNSRRTSNFNINYCEQEN